MPTCYFQSIAQRSENVLDGISWQNGQLKLDNAKFICCSGRGQSYISDGNACHICPLRERINALGKLLAKHYTLYHCDVQLTRYLKSKELLRIFDSPLKGHLFYAKELSASGLWPLTILAVWCFGKKVHFVTLGKTPTSELLPKARVDIIFVENITKLWDVNVVNDFEVLIDYAYHGNIGLFCEIINDASNVDPQGALSPFKKKLADIKQKNPFLFLEHDSLSKLEELCQQRLLSKTSKPKPLEQIY